MDQITLEVRPVSNFGIAFLNIRWWHASLVDYIGAEVYVCLGPSVREAGTPVADVDLCVLDSDLRMICRATRLKDPRRLVADLDRYGEDTE
jgi:hypothetical protein